MTLEYLLQRYYDNRKSTLGLFFRIGSQGLFHIGHTLEDEHRDDKLSGETRIPAGRYELKIRKVDSPLTEKYRKRYSYFKYHIELQDVPNFKYIYVHPGINEHWTDGCILLSDGPQTINGEHSLSGSAETWKRWYLECYNHLDFVHVKHRGEEREVNRAFITIRDEQFLIK